MDAYPIPVESVAGFAKGMLAMCRSTHTTVESVDASRSIVYVTDDVCVKKGDHICAWQQMADTTVK